MERRAFLGTVIAVATATVLPRIAAANANVEVYKGAECDCCGAWIEHLRKNGFAVTVHEVPDTAPYRAKAGIPLELASCHTAYVGAYAIEGHVPAADIKRLLAERPSGRALVAPGMTQTSPGMDAPHGEAWNVLLLSTNGTTRVFQSYPAK